MMTLYNNVLAVILLLCSATLGISYVNASNDLSTHWLHNISVLPQRPFVVVASIVTDKSKPDKITTIADYGQGVCIDNKGTILSVGHVTWSKGANKVAEKYLAIFRFPQANNFKNPLFIKPTNTMRYLDASPRIFAEKGIAMTAVMPRFIAKKDLVLLRPKQEVTTPAVKFYSKNKPKIQLGETFYLAHYLYPNKKADPIFMINPITITGLVDTVYGQQYLAKGFYRVGSSGGAILKDGKLIGIMSSAYTTNVSFGEQAGYVISFHTVWENLILKAAVNKEQ